MVTLKNFINMTEFEPTVYSTINDTTPTFIVKKILRSKPLEKKESFDDRS